MIGSEIKSIMEREGVSGYRISKETGIDETYLSKIFRNRINPSYVTLNRILKAMGYQICFEKVENRKKVRPESKISQKKPKKRR